MADLEIIQMKIDGEENTATAKTDSVVNEVIVSREGVIRGLSLTQTSPASLTLNISPGHLFINAGDLSNPANKPRYAASITGPATISIPTNAGVNNPRNHIVVYTINENDGTKKFEVISGTASATPKDPIIVEASGIYRLPLGRVQMPANASTVLTSYVSISGYTDTGSNNLTVSSILWKSDPDYANLVRYNFAGSPNLSLIFQEHFLTVTDAVNSSNNGTFSIIRVDNSAKFVEVQNLNRFDSSQDEGSTTATARKAELIRPTTAVSLAVAGNVGEVLVKTVEGVIGSSGKNIVNIALTNLLNQWSKAQRVNFQTINIFSGVADWNIGDANYYKLALNADITLNNPSEFIDGIGGIIILSQDNIGSRKIRFGTRVVNTTNVKDMIWQTANTVRIFFSTTSIDLSQIITGQGVAHISGSSKASNDSNGDQGYRITAVNNTAKWVEITNVNRTNSTDDETSSPATISIHNSIYKWQNGQVQTPSRDANSTCILSYFCQNDSIFCSISQKYS